MHTIAYLPLLPEIEDVSVEEPAGLEEIKNAIDYLEPEIISLPFNDLLIVDVQKANINNIVTSLNTDPHLVMPAVLRTQPKHENNKNNQEAAASLIRNLLLYPI